MCMYNWFTLLYSAITLSLQLSQHCKLTVCQLNKQANVTAYHLELLRKKLPWLLTGSQYIWESALIFLYLYLLHWLLLFSHSVVSDSLWPHGLQHARLPCFLPSLGACSNSCPLSWWCRPTISSSVIPFSCCLRFFPASSSFLMLFTSGGQSIEA